MFAILDAICNLIKREETHDFKCLYWVMKTYGCISMAFKDLEHSTNVYRKLKHWCEHHLMFQHKLVTYKQLGYIYRLRLMHIKAASCFKK